jgi:hypothetical protein
MTIGTNPSGATLAGTNTVSAISGVATFSNLSIDLAGTGYTLTASSTGLTGDTSSPFDISVGPATRLAFSVQPSTTVAGATLSPAVQITVQDAGGNTVTTSTASITVAISTNPGSGTLSGTATLSAVNGVATFSNLSINRTGTGYTLTASSSGLTSSTSSTFAITPGTATALAFSQPPTNSIAGNSISPAVAVNVVDGLGNTVTSSTASITVAIGTNPSGGSLSGTTTVSAVNGVATFSNLSINRSGSGYTLTGSSSGLAGATSAAFTVTPAAASRLVFSQQPSNATSTVAISPAVTVTVQDALGNTVTTSNASITMAIGTNPSGGILSGTTTVSAVNGVATFSSLSINRAGTGYTLTASSTGLSGATSTSFNISVGPASRLAFTVQPTNTVAGSAIDSPGGVQVSVQDAGGNTVTTNTASITVAIGTNPGGGTLSGTTTLSAVNGVATFSNLSINRTGTGYTLTASATGLTSATSSTFNLTPGAATKLAFVVQPSNTVHNQIITPAVQVAIQDALGNTVTTSSANITVAIGTNPNNGNLAGTATVATVNGVATFSTLSINKAGTGYTLTASGGGFPQVTSASFNIT